MTWLHLPTPFRGTNVKESPPGELIPLVTPDWSRRSPSSYQSVCQPHGYLPDDAGTGSPQPGGKAGNKRSLARGGVVIGGLMASMALVYNAALFSSQQGGSGGVGGT